MTRSRHTLVCPTVAYREQRRWGTVALDMSIVSADCAQPVSPREFPNWPGDLNQRRYHAIHEVLGELDGPGTAARPAVGEGAHTAGSTTPVAAMRSFGQGRLVVGLAGSFDRPASRRLEVLLRELRARMGNELVLEMSRLRSCPPALVQVLARTRMHLLIDGARVQLRGAPRPLAAQLGVAPPETFIVRDDADDEPKTGTGR